MARVICSACGRSEEARSMDFCARCGEYLCQRCAARDSLCPSCKKDEGLDSAIL